MQNIRVRFAPSPTGALHIGGVRTALYNYLLAKQNNGVFILRIEDTDQKRYVPGAEEYIIEALQWCGLSPDEGPGFGGNYGPYRQSERREIYQGQVQMLLDNGSAYYAFDTPEELEARREAEKEAGNPNFKYDAGNREQLRNSLSLSPREVEALLAAGTPYTVRLKVAAGETITIYDLIRGEVRINSDELDDKVLLKADGLPTYHLANIVDDHLMKITHVIRGEEWLPSTAHHVLLYRAFGWEDTMPQFAHLPLILKPNGQGKLSKRDGVKLGIPVFPLSWTGESAEESFTGFREYGFDPRAVVNFLALLGWNPGTEQEIFSLEELINEFSLEKISKSGARFDFDKAKWFNQQYIIHATNEELVRHIRPILAAQGHEPDDEWLERFAELMRERAVVYPDFWHNGSFLLAPPTQYDVKNIQKRWQPELRSAFEKLRERLADLEDYSPANVHRTVEDFMATHELKIGQVMPILRLALAGVLQGPPVYDMMSLLGREEVDRRLSKAYVYFAEVIA